MLLEVQNHNEIRYEDSNGDDLTELRMNNQYFESGRLSAMDMD